jgi:hypothetical protein
MNMGILALILISLSASFIKEKIASRDGKAIYTRLS